MAQPRIVGERGHGAMIAVAVDGPMRKQDVGLLGLKQFSELIIAGVIHDRVTVALGGEDRARLQNATSFLRLRDTHGAAFIWCCLRAGLFTSVQIQKRDVISKFGVARDRPAAAVLRIAGMAAANDDSAFAGTWFARKLRCAKGQRRHPGGY